MIIAGTSAIAVAAPGGPMVAFDPQGASFSGPPPNTETVGFRWQRNGQLIIDNGNLDLDTREWWTGAPDTDIGDSYEVRALSAGKSGTWDAAPAADDVWIAMTGTRTWSITSSGIRTTEATFEVRLAGSGSALDSAVMTATIFISN